MRPLDPALVRRSAGVRLLLAGSVALGIVSAVTIVAQAVLLATVIAAVVVGPRQDLTGQLSALIAVVLVRAGVAWAAEELAGRSAARVTTALRRELVEHAAALGPRWRAGVHGGRLATLAGPGIDALHGYLARYLPTLVLASLIPLAMVVVLTVLDPVSGVVVLLTLPLIPLFMALVGWYTDRRTRAKWQSLQRLSGHFSDVVAGLPTLRVFGRARAQAAAVRRVTDAHRVASMATLRVAFLSSLVLELLATLSVALVAVAVGLRLVDGGLGLRIGLTVLILAPEAYLPLRTLGTQFHAAADGVQAAGQVLAVLAEPAPTPGSRTDVPAVPGFSLRRVGLGPMESDPVESGRVESGGVESGRMGSGRAESADVRGRVGPFDLEIPAGRTTVVTGASGCGKTTLLRMLAGALRPDTGELTITGGAGRIGLAEVDPACWRDRLAWAGQQPMLRAGTVLTNLDADGLPETLVWQALSQVGADFVADLPGGLAARLGQDGAGLSQGQRQRLCLARVLLRARAGARLVLLDEPTAALDADTERRVLAGLERGLAGCTVVLVTHRAAPVGIADQLIVLDAAPVVTAPAGDSPAPRDLPPAGVW